MRFFRSIFYLFILFLPACTKESGPGVPEVVVDIRVTIQEFGIKNKNSVYLIDNRGVAGIILYKTLDNRFVAYDRCSTVNPEKRCAVTVDESGIIATDSCSGAKYSMFDGTPQKAPAKKSLKQYNVTADQFVIYIRNGF